MDDGGTRLAFSQDFIDRDNFIQIIFDAVIF